MSRRGILKLLLSDNAKKFKTASILVKKIFEIAKTAKVREFLLDHSMSWRLILAKSQWWGRFYERMVKEIKRPFRKVLGNAFLNIDELTTAVIEVESCLNSRCI